MSALKKSDLTFICVFPAMQTIHKKIQVLFSWKNKKNNFKCHQVLLRVGALKDLYSSKIDILFSKKSLLNLYIGINTIINVAPESLKFSISLLFLNWIRNELPTLPTMSCQH